MWRFLSVSLLVTVILQSPSAVHAADDEPTVANKKLSEWLENLKGTKARTERATLLHGLGVAASHPVVWKAQADARKAGVLAVAIIGPQKSREVFPALIGALRDDSDESIRNLAAQKLGVLGNKVHEDRKENRGPDIKLDDVRDGLVFALQTDKSAKVREACARSLGQLQEDPTKVVPSLAAALKDSYEPVQIAAAEALRVFGNSLAVRDELPRMEEALQNPKTNTVARVRIVVTMLSIDKDAAFNLTLLTNILKDEKEPDELRTAVAVTLGKIAKPETVADLKTVLAKEDANIELRRKCVEALDNFGADAKPALPELMKGMSDKDKFIRTSSMHAIGRIGKYLGNDSKPVVKKLLEICNESIPEVRSAAIETLGNLGPDTIGDDLPKVLEKLTDLSKDSQRSTQNAANDALKKLKPA
jgi:HEAT repeat protein